MGQVLMRRHGTGFPPAGTALEACSWAQIAKVSKAGKAASYWAVRAAKTLSVLGSTVTLHIADFNHDTLASGGTAGITFVTDVLPTTYAYGANYWKDSTLRPLLQPGGAIYETLPADLRALLAPATKRSYTALTNNASATVGTGTTSDYCWIPGWMETLNAGYDGTQYPYFSTAANLKQASAWWIRVPHPNSTGYCCIVSTAGAKSYQSYGTKASVRMCFCL